MNFHDEIAQMAYELFEKSGRVEGCDLSNWLEAERIVMARHRGEEKQESFSSPKKKKVSTTKQRIKKTETKKRRTKK